MKYITVNMGAQIPLRDSDFIFFRYLPRSGIAGSYDNYISNFFMTLHTVFHNNCINLTFLPVVRKSSLFLHPHQHLLFSVFFVITILTWVKWYLPVVLICLSRWLMILTPFPIFVGYLHVFIGKIFRFSAHFLIGLFVFLSWSFEYEIRQVICK